MTDVYIISGFLGAGKTTWIQKMLKEAFQGQKVVLIENDFGQASVDAALLKHQGVEVTEINSGCICCSLAGDFVKAISEILRRFAPEVLLIEPSGVGKLTDVMRACRDITVQPLLHGAGKMTVVDVTRFALYRENFGEFFEDQILQADVILLSQGGGAQEKLKNARLAVEELNPHAVVFDRPWDGLSANDVLRRLPESPFAKAHCHCGHRHGERDHPAGCGCGHDHKEHGTHEDQHDHDGGHDGHHDAGEVFESFTLSTERVFTREELAACFRQLESLRGNVVRAKGIVHGEGSNWNAQYVTGETDIAPTGAPAGMISFIGQDLDQERIGSIFQGN